MTPRLGTPAQFAALRRFLLESGYTEAAILERAGIATLSQALKLRSTGAPDGDTLDLLIRLLLLGEAAESGGYLTYEAAALLADLGLVEAAGNGIAATVELYPSRGLYLISDRNRGAELPAGVDKVFSAITPQTEEFISSLPDTPCPTFLELCAGAGLAALEAASKYAVQAFAYDISERSTLFAEFNRRLNGVGNATVARGDLYAPAGRRTFDRIVAHPPYVPSLRSTLLLRDGGEDGEDLTRRIVEALPNYLEPGGRLYCLALLAETQGESVTERVRRWLRDAESEFDVVVIERRRLDPARLVLENWPPQARMGDVERWQTIFRRRRIEAFVQASLVLQRRAKQRPVITLFRQSGSHYPVDAVEALLHELPARDARPVLRAEVRMSEHSRLEAGQWRASGVRYEADDPFRVCWEGPRWVRDFLARCDGVRACTELQPRDVPDDEFARAVRELAQGGIIRL